MTARATILARAFAKIGIAEYEYAVTPDERAEARGTLDSMMAEWDAAGIDLDFVPSGADDTTDIGSPVWADNAIVCNLALRLAPLFGKVPGQGLGREARRGYDLAVGKTVDIPANQNASVQIRSAGDRYYRRYGW